MSFSKNKDAAIPAHYCLAQGGLLGEWLALPGEDLHEVYRAVQWLQQWGRQRGKRLKNEYAAIGSCAFRDNSHYFK